MNEVNANQLFVKQPNIDMIEESESKTSITTEFG